MLLIFTSKALEEAGFVHGFSTRIGGVSPAPYDALDFAVLRDPEALRENQARLARAVGFELGALHQVTQVHGAEIVVANGDPASTLAMRADALVAEPGTRHAVAVRVADCVPVLLADPVSGRVAAVHAGWRGVEAGVIGAAVRRLAEGEGGGPATGLLAAIGPCIGPCCFEVDADVGARIARTTRSDVVVRRARGSGGEKAYVDLRRGARVQLRELGLDDGNVDDVPSRDRRGCTRCNAAELYSFRRDGDDAGRLVGVIVAR